jgi:hypothetical protein
VSVQKQFRRELVLNQQKTDKLCVNGYEVLSSRSNSWNFFHLFVLIQEQLQRDQVADKVASDPPKYINGVRNLQFYART